MRIFLLLLTIQILMNPAEGQVKGIIVDKEQNEPLIGVTILEKGTTNGTYSDIDGEFELKTLGEKPILVISYIGYKTQQLEFDSLDFLRIEMGIDTENIVICYLPFYPRYTRIGFNSGLINSPVGFRIENATPHLFGINTHLQTSFVFRNGMKSNKYIEFSFLKYNILRFSTQSELYLRGKISRIEYMQKDFRRIDRKILIGEVSYRNTSLGLGIIRQISNYTEKPSHGITVTINQQIYRNMYLNLGLELPDNHQQIYGSINQYIPKYGLNVGLKYEKIETYEELDFWVTYRIDY